ncbi:MAG: hypothetical protein LBH43_13875, partial [Treponema sp.]|nr:hypothetical protein [Treponema sp.]
MILDEFRKLVREQYEYAMTNVHICLPGKVVKYNAKTRRAEIQPCFKRKMPDGSYVNFPVVVDVPVRFFGTKKYTVHLPPEENDEVAIHFIERCTDVWKDEGHDEIEDKDPRRFNLQDCYVTLGLQPQEFIDVPEEGLVIKHWTAWDGD